MEKKKALAYREYLKEAICYFSLLMDEKQEVSPKDVKFMKRKYSTDAFENKYQEFEDELRDNYYNYDDFEVICSYIKTIFYDMVRWTKPDPVIIDNIITAGFEMEFLLRFHKNLNDRFDFINKIADQSNNWNIDYIRDYIMRITKPIDHEEDETDNETPNPLFIFKNLKDEIDNPELPPAGKLELAQQRLYDFLQWQKAFDDKEYWDFIGASEFGITARLYPTFEDMCRLEIERWKAVLATSPKNETASNAGTVTPKIRIASRHKLDVIKVFSAMYDLKWFTDGNHMPLTNKQQMMDALAEMLGDDFKSYSTNLSQAKDKSPDVFLKPFEELKNASRKYLDID